jgi:predicted acylesterase/phospholipase RssA
MNIFAFFVGRCVSIVVTPSSCSPGEALVLNFMTAPDVFIWSAVAASCALPGLLPPSELVSKGIHGDAKTLYSTGDSYFVYTLLEKTHYYVVLFRY